MAITPLPPAPEPTDSTAEFNSKAFAFVAALDDFVTETNALAVEVDADAATAAEGAEAAEAALGAANFKGEWSTLTGALAIPASVSHNGSVWVLTQSLADVTSNEPGVDSPNYWINVTPQPATAGTLQAIATGSLSDGTKVVINADGTVSAVSGSSPTVFESATISLSGTTGIAYDTANDKIVIAYTDSGNSDYGTAVVGTVSGTSISFGTPVVFESASARQMSVSYDSVNQKIVIFYTDIGNSNYGTAIVGTVSGTSISFGAPVVYNSGASWWSTSTYDVASGKMLVFYIDTNGTGSGNGRVGTVSGTSISFGSAENMNAGGFVSNLACVYDAGQSKTLLAYADNTASNAPEGTVVSVSGTTLSYGTPVQVPGGFSTVTNIRLAYDSVNAKSILICKFSTLLLYSVATISGTSVSFGTAASVEASGSPTDATVAYDANIAKFVVFYRDNTDCYINLGTLSGTLVTFSGKSVIKSGLWVVSNCVYDPDQEAAVVCFSDSANSSYGTALSIVNGVITNLTSENYIGISNAAYTNGQTATIQIVGSVDDAQTGLTAGQSYYVQLNGTLGLTAATPSVFAGTAVSATKLIVKG